MSLGWPGNASEVPPEELEEVSGVREVWASLLSAQTAASMRPSPRSSDPRTEVRKNFKKPFMGKGRNLRKSHR
ncbi:hypothetical protein L3Q82_024340 [Scortum barcoo]|uniref:Uncharacterized protein n=1 Tax=Scortum barcoo TaxID=214431 RepID=A0ACB8WVP8_9TELE|nr:hypothetical protein L3Q82_024340 [Scortum barcoo]